MKINRSILALLFSFVAFTALAETYTLDVGQFEKLKVNGDMNVVYRNLPDSTGLVRYEGPEGKAGTRMFNITAKGDGVLKVEPADNKWGRGDLPVMYVYSDFLMSVESGSNYMVDIQSLAPCAAFSVQLIGNGTVSVDNIKCNNVTAAITTGNGSIYLSGACINANFRMVGAGLISADRLRCDNVKCRILGTGTIGCWPKDNLKVTGLGTTKIYYKGDPEIKKSGGGKLFELPEEMDQDDYEKLGTPVTSYDTDSDDDDESAYEEDDSDDDKEDSDEEEEEDDDYQTVVTKDD